VEVVGLRMLASIEPVETIGVWPRMGIYIWQHKVGGNKIVTEAVFNFQQKN
jgi:hypothetical protein